MKKVLTIMIVTCTMTLGVTKQANAQAFEEGRHFITAGYGFPNLPAVFFKTLSLADDNVTYGALGPLHFKYEYGLTDKLGLGTSINFVTANGSYDDGNSYTEKVGFNSLNAILRLNWHFLDHDKVDFYWGGGIGYNRNWLTATSDNPDFDQEDADAVVSDLNEFMNLIPLGAETTLGLRFLFTDNIGGYFELGYSKSLIQFGVIGRL